MTKRQPLARTILIAGGGTAGWMAAAAFSKLLGPGWTIRLLESDAIGTVGVGEATIPQIQLFNQALGLDEGDFLRATQGTIKLGIEFVGWTRPGERYLHGFGSVGRGMGLIDFHHYWLRAHAAGIARPYHDHSLNNAAALGGKFAHVEPRGPIPPMPYAFHFDAGLYAAYLRRFAEARGVERHEGRIVDVEMDDRGDIAAVRLDGERRIAADWFVDATGFAALLIGGALGVGYQDWTGWLPCDRAVAVPCAGAGDPIPYTRATARAAGWQWRIPLQHRIGNGYVYSSAHLSDDAAAAVLLADLDGAPLADPKLLRFTTGKRDSFWHRNCVAIGLASGFLEPLESTSIHLVQTAIARILQFLPSAAMADADRAEYNRLTHLEVDGIRDFLVLHYYANQRVGERFWDDARAMALPEELARKIALFRGSARLSRRDEELFAEPGWLQVMLGQGIVPDAWHPIADAPSVDDLTGFLTAAHAVAHRTAAALPTHGAYLSHIRQKVAA